jgi:nicotinate-nucleotide adenylyltransferase
METGNLSVGERCGLFGGTFDPVHSGHLLLAERAREELDLDTVLFVPANVSPHKVDGREISSGVVRVEMLERAIDGNQHFILSQIELDRRGLSYTRDTMEKLAAEHSGTDFTLLMGSDNARDFRSWRDPSRILELASIAVWERPGEYFWPEIYPDHIARKIPAPLVEISSTEIRNRTAAGRSIRYMTPDVVVDFIRENGLYR